jgi:hypothetical protein
MNMITGLVLAGSLAFGNPLNEPEVIHKDGMLRVLRGTADDTKNKGRAYNYLMKLDVHFGLNFLKSKEPPVGGDAGLDPGRLPTCYHHPRSPIGIVMQTLEAAPFPGQENVAQSDVRLPASLIGLGATPLASHQMPDATLVGMNSQPPYAVIGMHIGTMAAYAHPFQEIHFFDNNPKIIELSLPKEGTPHFTYLLDAKQRGAHVKVFQGKERAMVAARAPNGYYQVMVVEMCLRSRLEDVCVEFMTKEGVSLLMDKMTETGIVCYHVSNRYLDMTPVLADVAQALGLAVMHSQDPAPDGYELGHDRSHFSSEWVMLARKKEYLARLKPPSGYDEIVQEVIVKKPYMKHLANQPFWDVPKATGKYAWTDQSRHPLRGLLRFDPAAARLSGLINMGLKVSDGMVSWKKLAGVPEHTTYYMARGFSPLMVPIRAAFDQTVEDLQKGWPAGY